MAYTRGNGASIFDAQARYEREVKEYIQTLPTKKDLELEFRTYREMKKKKKNDVIVRKIEFGPQGRAAEASDLNKVPRALDVGWLEGPANGRQRALLRSARSARPSTDGQPESRDSASNWDFNETGDLGSIASKDTSSFELTLKKKSRKRVCPVVGPTLTKDWKIGDPLPYDPSLVQSLEVKGPSYERIMKAKMDSKPADLSTLLSECQAMNGAVLPPEAEPPNILFRFEQKLRILGVLEAIGWVLHLEKHHNKLSQKAESSGIKSNNSSYATKVLHGAQDRLKWRLEHEFFRPDREPSEVTQVVLGCWERWKKKLMQCWGAFKMPVLGEAFGQEDASFASVTGKFKELRKAAVREFQTIRNEGMRKSAARLRAHITRKYYELVSKENSNWAIFHEKAMDASTTISKIKETSQHKFTKKLENLKESVQEQSNQLHQKAASLKKINVRKLPKLGKGLVSKSKQQKPLDFQTDLDGFEVVKAPDDYQAPATEEKEPTHKKKKRKKVRTGRFEPEPPAIIHVRSVNFGHHDSLQYDRDWKAKRPMTTTQKVVKNVVSFGTTSSRIIRQKSHSARIKISETKERVDTALVNASGLSVAMTTVEAAEVAVKHIGIASARAKRVGEKAVLRLGTGVLVALNLAKQAQENYNRKEHPITANDIVRAAHDGRWELVVLGLDQPPEIGTLEPDAVNDDGTTALITAFKFLLGLDEDLWKAQKKGSYKRIQNFKKKIKRYEKLIKYLLRRGADLNFHEKTDLKTGGAEHEYTCIHYAAKAGNMQRLVWLIEDQHVDIDPQDEQGITPLMLCCQMGFPKEVCYMLSWEANLHHVDKYGRTALHYAAIAGSVTIKVLLLSGAKQRQKDMFDKTPSDLAKDANMLVSYQLLEIYKHEHLPAKDYLDYLAS